MSRMTLNVGVKGLKNDTKLNGIDVPPKLRERNASGLSFFDGATGAMVPSTVMMLTGTPGAGKTTMLMQVADGLTKNGHIVLYNTGEESLYQVRMVSERLGLDADFYVGQHTLVSELLKHADSLRKTHKGKQVFVLQDSLQTLDDGKYANGGTTGRTPLRCTEMLTEWAKRTFMNVIFIGQVTKGGDFAGKNAILHAIDVRGHLYIDEEKKSDTYGERIFEVTKNRFGTGGKAYIVGIGGEGLYEKGVITYG